MFFLSNAVYIDTLQLNIWPLKSCRDHPTQLKFKLKTIAILKSEFSGNLSKASKVLNISRKQLRDWQKKEVKMANMTNKEVKRHTGGRGAKYPLLEEQLFAWFKEQRESKYTL